jgi:hypothetical protein
MSETLRVFCTHCEQTFVTGRSMIGANDLCPLCRKPGGLLDASQPSFTADVAAKKPVATAPPTRVDLIDSVQKIREVTFALRIMLGAAVLFVVGVVFLQNPSSLSWEELAYSLAAVIIGGAGFIYLGYVYFFRPPKTEPAAEKRPEGSP